MDNTVVHFEIPAENVEKLKSFYSDLFGWKIEKSPMPMDYWIIQTVPTDDKGTPLRPGINGGLFPKENRTLSPVNYISVENIDKCIEKVEALGSKIVMPKQTVTGVGSFAIAVDPEGNRIGLLQPEMP